MKPNIIAYHVNDEERCKRFVDEESYLIISQDTTWLGYGMYFWDNKSNVDYWLRHKKKNNKNNLNFITVKCNLIIDNVLDLTDKSVLYKIEQFWKNYCLRSKKNVNVNEKRIGVKLNILFEFFNKELSNYKVIKAIGVYPKELTMSFVYNCDIDIKKAPHIITNIKVIYTLREHYESNAVNREIMEVQ